MVVSPHVCGWNLGHSRCREDSERECGADASEYGRSVGMAGHDQCLDSAGWEVHSGVFPRLRIGSLQILCAPIVRARQPGGALNGCGMTYNQISRPFLIPGRCPSKAHDREHIGVGGRRVLVSREWSGQTLSEHRADRAAVVREALLSAGMVATEI